MARARRSPPPSSFTHVPRRIEGRGRCRPSKRNPRDSRNKGAAIFHAPAAPDVIAPPYSFVFRPTVANDSKLAPIHLPRKGQREKSRVGRETRHVRGATWLGYVSRATIEESWGGAEGRARTERYLNSRVPFLELETVKSHRCAISFYLDRAISIALVGVVLGSRLAIVNRGLYFEGRERMMHRDRTNIGARLLSRHDSLICAEWLRSCATRSWDRYAWTLMGRTKDLTIPDTSLHRDG